MTGSAELLEQARVAHGACRSDYRRNMLATGVLLHKYVEARLLEGAALPERRRLAAHLTRSRAVKDAGAALGVQSGYVSMLIQTAMMVELLAPEGLPEGPEEVPWLVLRLLAKLVRRKTHPGGRRGRSDGGPVEDMEVWQAVASYRGEDPRAVLGRAVRERWTAATARGFVNGAGGEGGAGYRNPNDRDRHRPNEMVAARCGSPRDVTERLAELIEAAADPLAVVGLLEQRLPELRRRLNHLALVG